MYHRSGTGRRCGCCIGATLHVHSPGGSTFLRYRDKTANHYTVPRCAHFLRINYVLNHLQRTETLLQPYKSYTEIIDVQIMFFLIFPAILLPEKLKKSIVCVKLHSVTCMDPGLAVLSILLATLTVLPQMSYWGFLAPMTPATTGPTFIPTATATKKLNKKAVRSQGEPRDAACKITTCCFAHNSQRTAVPLFHIRLQCNQPFE